MFERVLRACVGSAELQGTLVATDDAEAAALATRLGAAVLRDRAERPLPLSAVVDTALTALAARGATHALVLMADLPLLQARDLHELLAQLRSADIAIAPDPQRRGTSALGLRLGLGVRTGFGHPDSLQRHLREAARVGARTHILHNPRLAFDVDSPADLALARGYEINSSLRRASAPCDRARSVSWR